MGDGRDGLVDVVEDDHAVVERERHPAGPVEFGVERPPEHLLPDVGPELPVRDHCHRKDFTFRLVWPRDEQRWFS